MKRRYEHGEVLPLSWPDGMDAAYIVGHMSTLEADAALRNAFGDDYKFHEPFPAYGRFVFVECPDEPHQTHFVTGYKKAPGAMAVMEAHVDRSER